MKHITAVTVFAVCMLLANFASAGGKRSNAGLDYSTCPPESIKHDDGDSFFCADEEIRMLGADTPEIIHEEHGIFIDQPKGRKAAAFTKKLLSDAKRIIIVRGGRDKYGRSLAHVLIDGELLGAKLIKAGLAYENVSLYGDNGMPEFALQILEASKISKKPAFENPSDWRKKNQRRQ